jgi:Cu-Zn family superoxide dismutase
MRAINTWSWVLVLAVVIVGCSRQAEDPGDQTATPATGEPKEASQPRTASAVLEAKSDSSLTGTAVFTEKEGFITLTVELQNTAPGVHALHIHEVGDCSAADGTSAGGHWNPTAEDHGKWGTPPHHLGDLGNLTVSEDGTGLLELVSMGWSMGTGEANDIVGKAVVVHAGQDDFTSQPTGAAGGRIGCGVIGQ